MYPEFIQKITQSGLIPGFKIVDTSTHKDLLSMEGRHYKPDPSMYRDSGDTTLRPTQFDELELNFEFKRDANGDPFIDPKDNESSKGNDVAQGSTMDETGEECRNDRISKQRRSLHFESDTATGRDSRGQLTIYATEWFAHQHRLFGFTVFIFYPFARFIRWDRSGAVVTARFDIRGQSGVLAEFLWRFVHLSDIGRGRDPTVRKATTEETRLAKEQLSDWKKKSGYPAYVFKVPDSNLGADREFIAWGWLARPDSLVGRATRAYPVYEKATGKVYFLKDSWRAVMTEKEADILLELNAAGVRNVPRLVCGDDLDGHHTLSQIQGVEVDSVFYNPATSMKRPWWKCGQYFAIERIHHRFVEDFIGKHISSLTSSKQLLQVTYDAFIGHEDAFVKCRILHRDVSGKNVMMTLDGRGILNDWDLAKRIPKSGVERPRTPYRTGTWQFISAMLLKYPGKRHVVQDDMESFIYVVLYHAFRYLQHKAVPNARSLVGQLFDEAIELQDGTVKGGLHKTSFFNDPDDYVGFRFAFLQSPPLQAWYKSIIPPVAAWHKYEKQLLASIGSEGDSETDDEATAGNDDDFLVPPEPLAFANHQQLRKFWEKALSRTDWPDKENIIDHVPDPLRHPEPKPIDHDELGSRFVPSTSSKRSHDGNSKEDGPVMKKGKTSPSYDMPVNGRAATRKRSAHYYSSVM